MIIVAVPVVKAGNEYFVSPHFGKTPYFAIVEISGKSYRLVNIVENRYATMPSGGGKGAAIAQMLASYGVNAVLSLEVGSGAFNHLLRYGIKVFYISLSKVSRPSGGGAPIVPLSKAIEMLIDGEVEEGTSPREID
jgi:predicted Fe-Mo cluster-binding NifX family protein